MTPLDELAERVALQLFSKSPDEFDSEDWYAVCHRFVRGVFEELKLEEEYTEFYDEGSTLNTQTGLMENPTPHLRFHTPWLKTDKRPDWVPPLFS